MTPREYFDLQPHGAIKQCCRKTGYSVQFVSYVINGRRHCSEFFAQVLESYSGGVITAAECNTAQKINALN